MSVRVVARIRPLLKHELGQETIVKTDPCLADETKGRPTVIRIPNPKNESESFSFQFSSVYQQESTQQELFDAELSPTVKHLFNGFDLSIFAHGSTGTGKTHTMRGGKSLADRGVIPRLLSSIYRRCKKVEKDTGGHTRVDVSMEYFEIYCDRIYDLFESAEKRTASGLPIRDNNGKTVVVGLTERPCASLKEFETLYDQANVNRSTSATKLNAHSSRSHAILCVKVTQTTDTTIRISKASCIDLAGSEDNRRTQNDKERMVESNAINSSLFALANCVDAINKKAPRIPYRESKMTRILSLGQNSGLTIMILNLSPIRSYHLDTLSSLNFASRTKRIEVNEVENDPVLRTIAKPFAAMASVGGTNITRQPLRPLTTANSTNRNDADNKKQALKPIKAFHVYSDTRNLGPTSQHAPTSNQGLRRKETTRHPAGALASTLRPTTLHRGQPSTHRSPSAEAMLSKESIEALISQRIDEKLAEKALQDAAAALPNLSADLQKRLDDLEQRIDAKDDDERAQGLQYLLMAKQHAMRGEDASAMRMYRLALPFFPDNEKLKAKMQAVAYRMRTKRDAEVDTSTGEAPALPASTMKECTHTAKSPTRAFKRPADDSDEEEEYNPSEDSGRDELHMSGASSQSRKPSKKSKKSVRALSVYRDGQETWDDAPPKGQHTPRTAHLLKIINSRDVAQIRALRGVGAKKADAIVSSLMETNERDVQDLDRLASLRGIGGKAVANMRMGLSVGC